MAKLIKSKIENLTPDDHNFNKGSEYGNHLIEKSFREFGAGRSILIDRNNRIIAGNKSIEAASSIGMENVVIVETTGDEIVAVKRTDIDLDSKKGRELALADNATNKANLDFDEEEISKLSEQFEFDASDWGVMNSFDADLEMPENLDGDDNEKPFVVKLTFDNEKQIKEFNQKYSEQLRNEFNCSISLSGGGL